MDFTHKQDRGPAPLNLKLLHRGSSRHAHYALLLLVLLFFAFVRLRLRNMPLERDEGEYAYVGQLMLQGIPPYKLACNMKLPGTHAAYAATMAIFGETPAGIRTGLVVVNAATSILVFLLTNYLYGSLAGSVAGVTYAFLSCRPAVMGVYGHATHFVVLAALAAILLLLRAMDTRRTGLFFASGLCFGLAFLMKQPGILFAFFAAFYWVSQEWRRPLAWRSLAVGGGALFTGLTLPFGLTCLILFRAGVFPSFWFWTWSYAREYGSVVTLSEGWHQLRVVSPWALRPFVIWEIVALGLVAPVWSRYARIHGGGAASFFLFSWLAVCPGLYFRPHYFILLLPAAALCTGIAVDAATQALRDRQARPLLVALPVLYFAVTFVISVRAQYYTFLHLDPVSLTRKMYFEGPFLEAVVVADYIKARSSDQDTIGIIGSEPEICFYAARHCASRYLYTYPLMEKQKFARQMQDDMMQEFERAQPRFLVYVDLRESWGALQENRRFLEMTWAYAHRDYQLVDQVAIAGDREHLWGDHAYLYVFHRTGT